MKHAVAPANLYFTPKSYVATQLNSFIFGFGFSTDIVYVSSFCVSGVVQNMKTMLKTIHSSFPTVNIYRYQLIVTF